MKDVVTCVLLLLLVAAEVTLWVANPMHISAAFLPARAFGLQAFKELDSSMKPGISPGQYIIVSAWSYWQHEPQAGDVVAFQYPPNPAMVDVKRIIAVGGSTVAMRDGITYVDGKRDPWSHLEGYAETTVAGLDQAMTTVPRGSYFVMGDDRDSSYDSRDYGVIRRGEIIGEAVWPARLRVAAQAGAKEALADR